MVDVSFFVGDPCVVFVVLISVVGFEGFFCDFELYYLRFFLFFSVVSGRRCILVMWCLKAAVLCSKRWLDSKFMVVSVVVCFLYMSISRCGGFRFMFRSRKYTFPFYSCVRLSFILLCIWLM
jgi:hypothetical protein